MILPSLLALLAAPALPQGDLHPVGSATVDLPPGLDPERLATLADALLLDEPGDGRTWARGATYKASFGAEGFTYRPFLGPDAPQSFPLRLDLDAVTIAGESLRLGPRVRSRDEATVRLERGAVREEYHLGRRDVEQTFVFEALPARGALELRMDVETELAPRADGAGSSFSCAHGEVRYGAATAIDAAGRAVALDQRLDAGDIVITVPADFVERATLPLVVDPILSTFSVATDSRRQLDVDVAYEGNAATYQIVFSQLESGADIDVISVLYNASLGILFPAESIDITGARWSAPANASASGPGTFLCASVTGLAIGNRVVRGRTLEAATGVRGPQFDISGFGAETVDVGGKGNGIDSVYDFFVVWQEADVLNADFDIVGQAVDDTSSLTGNRVVIDGDPGDMDLDPAISKSSGRPGSSNANNEYMIVWEREQSPTNHDLRCQVIEYTGSLVGHSQFSGYTFSDALDPEVSSAHEALGIGGGERHWAIVFERRVGSDYDIFAVGAVDGDAYNARNLTSMQDLDLQRDQRDPRIAFDAEDYLVVYQTERPGGERTVEMTAFNLFDDGAEIRAGLTLRRDSLGSFADGASSFAIASHWEGGGPFGGGEPGDALAAWTTRTNAADDGDLAAAIVAEVRIAVEASQFCAANVNSSGERAWMTAFGNTAGSNSILTCESMPPNQFGIFNVSASDGFVPNAGGSQGNLCLQGAIGRFNGPGQILSTGPDGTMMLLFDSEELPLPTGSYSVLPGETWYYQAWFRDGGTSNFSNGLRITYQ